MLSARRGVEHVVCNVMRDVVQWWRDVEWRDAKGGVIKILWCDMMECVKMFSV